MQTCVPLLITFQLFDADNNFTQLSCGAFCKIGSWCDIHFSYKDIMYFHKILIMSVLVSSSFRDTDFQHANLGHLMAWDGINSSTYMGMSISYHILITLQTWLNKTHKIPNTGWNWKDQLMYKCYKEISSRSWIHIHWIYYTLWCWNKSVVQLGQYPSC